MEDTAVVGPALEVVSSPLDTGPLGVVSAGGVDDSPPVAAGDESGEAGELSADPDFVIAIPPEPSVVVGSGTELEAAEGEGEDATAKLLVDPELAPEDRDVVRTDEVTTDVRVGLLDVDNEETTELLARLVDTEDGASFPAELGLVTADELGIPGAEDDDGGVEPAAGAEDPSTDFVALGTSEELEVTDVELP